MMTTKRVCEKGDCKDLPFSRNAKYCKEHSPTGKGTINNGYRRVRINGIKRYEHQLVMEDHLSRPLESHENVHHRDGDRLNNTIGNLELWSRSQPTGQRVEDKLEWAYRIIKLYEKEYS